MTAAPIHASGPMNANNRRAARLLKGRFDRVPGANPARLAFLLPGGGLDLCWPGPAAGGHIYAGCATLSHALRIAALRYGCRIIAPLDADRGALFAGFCRCVEGKGHKRKCSEPTGNKESTHCFPPKACPGEVEPVRRQTHASIVESRAFPAHMGSPGDPI